MITYNKYVFKVLVPHVVLTAVVFWGMVLAWIVGWLPFDTAVLIAIIAVALLLVHGAGVAVWSVSAANKEKTQIDASRVISLENASAPLPHKVKTAEVPKVDTRTPSLTVVDRAAEGITAPPVDSVPAAKTRPVVVKFAPPASADTVATVDSKPIAAPAQEQLPVQSADSAPASTAPTTAPANADAAPSAPPVDNQEPLKPDTDGAHKPS